MVGKSREEEEEGPVGREELELEVEVVGEGVEVVLVWDVVGLVQDHCFLFHSSAGTKTDHSGLSVEERRVEVSAHMMAEAVEDADGQAEDEDGAVEDGAAEDEELEPGDEQERGHGQGEDEVCCGVCRLEKHQVGDTLDLGDEGGRELGLGEELVEAQVGGLEDELVLGELDGLATVLVDGLGGNPR